MACVLCRTSQGLPDVYFSPCSHKACQSCVNQLRKAIVFKADRGVKCPICQQVIDSFRDKPPSGKPLAIHSSTNYGRGGVLSWGGGNDYSFPRATSGSDGAIRLGPKGDDILPGYVIPPLRDNVDLLAMAMDKTGARHLDFMLRENHPKRHKVASKCREVFPPFCTKLAMHPYGNFVYQRMVEYAHAYRQRNDGYFTAIIRGLCRDKGLITAAMDLHGCYSVQKTMHLMRGSEELRLVLKCLSGSVVSLCLHQHGVYVVERLVEGLIASVKTGTGADCRFFAKDAVEALVQLTTEAMTHVDDIGSHQVSGTMFVECIRWTLPNENALAAGMLIACHSRKLMTLRNANRTLQGLLSLEVKQIVDKLIDSLKGHFLDLGLDQCFFGPKLLKACFATRCVGEATRLSILQELLDVNSPSTQDLLDNHSACNLLTFGLSLLSERNLNSCLDYVHKHFGLSKHKKLVAGIVGTKNWLKFQAVPLLDDISASFEETGASDPWDEDEPSVLAAVTPTLVRSQSSSSSASSDAWESASTSLSPEAPAPSHSTSASYPASPSLPSAAVKPAASPRVPQAVPPAASIKTPASGGKGSQGSIPEHPFGKPGERYYATAICKVCQREPVSALLMNCYHTCCCLVCGYTSNFCPICQEPIQQVVEMRPVPELVKPIAPPARDPWDLLPSDLYEECGDAGWGTNARTSMPPRPYRPPDVFNYHRN